MRDTTILLNNSTLQYGAYNDRVYIMKLYPADTKDVLEKAETLASEGGLSKIFAKIPLSVLGEFKTRGYIQEACVPPINKHAEGFAFVSRFLTAKRKKPRQTSTIMRVKAAAQKNGIKTDVLPALPAGYEIDEARKADCSDLAQLYAEIFPSYPFPIMDPDFLCSNMESNVRYFMVRYQGEVVAASAAEMDGCGVEMTDFATLATHRGKNLASHLLHRMEIAMTEAGVPTAFTIARAVSFGMNITFGKAGYEFGGTLRNNTNISGDIESMNVWYKSLTNN